MFEIERTTKKAKSIPLVSLIDVVFQLLIYLMITTSFVHSESIELLLPPAVEANKKTINADKEKTLHIYISDIGETFLEQKSINEQEMAAELHNIFVKNPERGVLVLSANKVTVQVLVRVMDRIYTAGGKNVAVADWIIPVQPSKQPEVKNNG
ncbi:MAG: biopolymer transporter ExbD [Pseudomonadota bacterium]